MRDGRRKVEQVGRGLIINSLIFWSSSLLFLKLFFYCLHCYTCSHLAPTLPSTPRPGPGCPPLRPSPLLSVPKGYARVFFGESLHLLSSSLLTPLLADSCRSAPCVHDSVSILFVSLFCSSDSTYK